MISDATPRAPGSEAHSALQLALQVSVPLAIWSMAGWSPQERQRVAGTCSQVIAEHGDVLMYGGKKCAAAFAALSKGLAALAHQPGGVTFAGLHWCVGSGHHGTRHDAPCTAELTRESANHPGATR